MDLVDGLRVMLNIGDVDLCLLSVYAFRHCFDKSARCSETSACCSAPMSSGAVGSCPIPSAFFDSNCEYSWSLILVDPNPLKAVNSPSRTSSLLISSAAFVPSGSITRRLEPPSIAASAFAFGKMIGDFTKCSPLANLGGPDGELGTSLA